VLEEGVGVGDGGCGAELGEDVAGVVEDGRSLVGPSEGDEAAAVALQGVGVFGGDAELFPARRGVCVPISGCLVVAAGFGEDGGGGYQGVVGVGRAGLISRW
jgi:hypothetical protein